MSAGSEPIPVRVVLASTSPYRRALLERLGVPFECLAPPIDEGEWKGRGLTPHALAGALALAKAESLAGAVPAGSVVIGGDQVVAWAGQVFGKAGSPEGAVRQLLNLAGKTHELVTALAVCRDGLALSHTDVTTLRMRPLTREEAERYVAADRPWDCAGSYKLESRGIVLFEAIESADQTAVIGLPLIALTTILRGLGVAIP